MMRDTKALNDYQSKQTVVFLIGYSTTLDQGFIASLPPFLTSIRFLMLLIHMDETYQKHHHPFEVQINCTIHSQTIHLPHNLRSPRVFCSGESLLMFHEFRFLSKLDFFHSCYVDVLDYENIPTINNQTIPKNWGSKKNANRMQHLFSSACGVGCFSHFFGPFSAKARQWIEWTSTSWSHNTWDEWFFQTQRLRDRRDPNNFEEFLSTACRTWTEPEPIFGCKNMPVFQDFWHGGSRDVGFRVLIPKLAK